MTGVLHPKASYWIKQGIFDDLRTFEAFQRRVNKLPDYNDRGDVFEIFIEGYLQTQPITQCAKHWVVGNIPLKLRERYNLPRDASIDGIYETHDGSQLAYKVEYRQKEWLGYPEVAPFLGITEKFYDRVVFTNAIRLARAASVRTRWVSGEAFRALSPNALGAIEGWLKAKPVSIVRAKPDPNYQVQALADIRATLAKHDRATAVMACATGKTLIGLWVAELRNPKTVLVLVPSLALLQQTLREWSQQTKWGKSFRYLCVCSDPTVGLGEDVIAIDQSEVEFRIDTDPAVVRRFLRQRRRGIRVIFSTYQSSAVVGRGAKGLPPIDLAIFDEAHKTTGLAGSAFGYALSDRNIRIRKRLFLTATPRHVDIRHRGKQGDFRIYSMDDESVYGPCAHKLSFAEAANKGIICHYKVVISVINKKIVNDFALKHGITIVQNNAAQVRWIANLIATQQAIDKVKAHKIITFHSRVKFAKNFAFNKPLDIGTYLKGYDVRHVNGRQDSADRSDIMRTFAEEPKALVTNARCLTEGVNIPAVDMVAFIDPKRGRIDIAQTIGRAMRKPRGPTNKKYGYVLVPLFAGMGKNDSTEAAVQGERFDVVADVVNALQAHDEELVDIIRELKQRKGSNKPFNPRRLLQKLQVIGPRISFERLTKSIGVEIADRIGVTWDEYFGLLQRFKTREGHCLVPKSHVEGKFKLGTWVSTQRKSKNTMPSERRKRLDAIGFVWDAHESVWEEGFSALKRFKKREGHCLVPQSHLEGKFKLGIWVSNQRKSRVTMSAEHRRRLDKIGFVWEPFESAWEEGFSALKRFKKREGHCRVPQPRAKGTFSLGWWVARQRRHRDSMSAEHRRRLDKIGFVWDPLESQWECGFASLRRFKKREGHCRVPTLYIEGTFKFGNWVKVQRRTKGTMSAEHRRRLDKIGFVWEPFESAWEEGFSALKRFKKREGHCRVPKHHVEGNFKLGTWVSIQRHDRYTMPAKRRQRLDRIGFVWRAK